VIQLLEKLINRVWKIYWLVMSINYIQIVFYLLRMIKMFRLALYFILLLLPSLLLSACGEKNVSSNLINSKSATTGTKTVDNNQFTESKWKIENVWGVVKNKWTTNTQTAEIK